jgi:hypothetical protein
VATLRKVQLRRWWPTALIQAGQRIAHRRILTPVLTAGDGDGDGAGAQHGGFTAVGVQQSHHAGKTTTPAADPAQDAPTASLPAAMRLLRRFPALQVVPARIIAVGPLPEHAPSWARRPTLPVSASRAGTAPGS